MIRFAGVCLAVMFFWLFSAGAGDVAKNVKITREGKCLIENIPQVSQKKSFCVPASVAMVLRYYDDSISQRKLARLFETDNDGTDPQEILRHIGVGKFSEFSAKCIYTLTVADYNAGVQAVLSHKKLKRKNRKKIEAVFPERMANEVLSQIPAEVAKEAMFPVYRHTDIALKKALSYYVANGIPLLWSVFMCFDPDESSDAGHMRLIVGFVQKDGILEKIIYRDPWGNRTKFKEMDYSNAVVMTHSLFVITRE